MPIAWRGWLAPRTPRGSFLSGATTTLLRPQRSGMLRGLIFPVPDPRFPLLGTHFTLRPNGEVWLGSHAVLAFASEGYHRLAITAGEFWETLRY